MINRRDGHLYSVNYQLRLIFDTFFDPPFIPVQPRGRARKSFDSIQRSDEGLCVFPFVFRSTIRRNSIILIESVDQQVTRHKLAIP